MSSLSESEDQSEQITNAKDSDPSLGASAFKRSACVTWKRE
jgi:hypothetical protein